MKDQIKYAFEKVTGRDLEDYEWDLSLEGDLDMDGLDFVEFIMCLESRLQISIPDDQAEALSTPNQWLAYLVAILKESTPLEPKNEIMEIDKSELRELQESYVELRSLKQSIIESPLKQYFRSKEMSFHDKVMFAVHDLVHAKLLAYDQMKEMLESYAVRIKELEGKESTPFHCPNCGNEWDTEKFNACECGVTIKRSEKRKKESTTEQESQEELLQEIFDMSNEKDFSYDQILNKFAITRKP